jgi:hypothetical protein
MKAEQLHDLVERIEVSVGSDPDLAAAVLDSMKSAFPNEAELMTLEYGLTESTEAALHLISLHVPNWSIKLQGHAHEPDGRWTCTLRESAMGGDDELIGIGRGPTPALALLAALLRLLEIAARGYS